MPSSKTLPILLGVAIWLLLALLWFPASPLSQVYVHWILVAAPLWIVPLSWRLLDVPLRYNWLALGTATLLAIAYTQHPSPTAGLLVLPWAFLCFYLTIKKLFQPFRLSTEALGPIAAFIYLSVGVVWMFADRWGYALMDFESVIILLTGVHFHYAGFLLILLTIQLIPLYKKIGKILAWGVMAGMPLVAIGITGEQVNLPPLMESLAVTVMTSAGFGVGLAHLGLGWKYKAHRFGLLFMLGGLALTAGMSLGFLYGWRHFLELSFLSIPWMYAVHGSLNAIGFAIPCVLGWSFFKTKN